MNYRTWNQTFNLLFLKSGFFFKSHCSSNHQGSLRVIFSSLYCALISPLTLYVRQTESPIATYFYKNQVWTPILVLITHETKPVNAQCVNYLPEVHCTQERVNPDYVTPFIYAIVRGDLCRSANEAMQCTCQSVNEAHKELRRTRTIHEMPCVGWHFTENVYLFCPFSNRIILRTSDYTHSCLVFPIEIHFHIKTTILSVMEKL